MPHPIFTLLTALLLSVAMAAVENCGPRERVYVAVRVFACSVMSLVGGGWVMRLIHG